MSETFQRLFDPISIGNVRLKNRIAMAPMAVDYMVNPDGSLNQRVVDYYLERVRNEVGMIICSVFKVENKIEALQECSPQITESSLGYLGDLCGAAHSYGAKVFVQLTAGYGRVAAPSTLRGPCVSASALSNFWDPGITCRALTTEEVEQIVQAMGEVAERLVIAGVDGVELHGHEGYLFDQFTSAIWNKRADKYGGSLENQLRFPIECLEEIRRRIGDRLAVQYRFGLKHYMKDANSGALPGEEFQEFGRDVDEGLEMAGRLEKAGFDALHVDAGCYESHYWSHPPMYQKHGCMVEMPAKAKRVVKIPVIGVGRLDIPELAEKIVEDGKVDIIAIGRGLLADPHWAARVKTGKVEDIRPCVGCYDGCFTRYALLRHISCALNPSSGRERTYQLIPAHTAKRIVVIGGGIAGMEAARVAAIRGHDVTLYEKETSLGGMIKCAAVPEFKNDLKRLLAWYERQIRKTGVQVKLGTMVSPEDVAEENPGAVFVATGAKPIIPDIPGIEKDNVATSVDILEGKTTVGDSAVIIGGGLVGCEIAIWLAQKGKRATIVEMLPTLMSGGIRVPGQVKMMIHDLLAAHDVDIVTRTRVSEITSQGVRAIQQDFRMREVTADTVVLAMGMAADRQLYDNLAERLDCVYALGDCREPKNIMNAVWDAYEIARTI